MDAPMEDMEENVVVQDDERWAFYSVLMVEKTVSTALDNNAKLVMILFLAIAGNILAKMI